MSDGLRMQQLERAIRAYVEHRGSGESRAAFLARHAELREFLEPMLDAGATEPGDDAEPAAGQRELGDFRLLRELGRGGMGVVYEARQLSLPRRVALKVLCAHLTLQPGSVARFKAEAVTAARLLHPGIVRILVQGSAGDAHFFAMELVHGATLHAGLDELRSGDAALDGHSLAAAVAKATARAFPAAAAAAPARPHRSHAEAAAELALQVADALAHGHAHGVVHRDVKPANIMVRRDGSAVLTDFGLARDQDLPGITASGAFAGTPHYSSPEQASGRRDAIDQRTDVFALGVTLYELLTLRRPFEGDTSQQVLWRIQTQDPPDPESLRSDVPPDLAAVVLKALEKDGRRRYPTAAAFAADLRAFLMHLPVAARRASPLERLRRWRRREPAKAALAAMLAVAVPALASGGGYLWARRDEIRAGRAGLLLQQVQDDVDRGFCDYMLEAPDLGRGHFEAALAKAPGTVDAGVGVLFAVLKHDGPAAALLRLDDGLGAAMPGQLPDLLRASLLLRLSRRQEANALLQRSPQPTTEFELFVYGMISRDRTVNSGTELLEYVERAVLAGRRPRLWIHVHWAVFADAARDAASCRRCAANLLLNWPDSPVALYFAAIALRHVDPEHAEQVVRQALPRHADSGLLYCALGHVLRARGQQQAATAALQRAVELAPGMAALHYSYGCARLDAGDHAGAVAELRLAHELAPRLIDAMVGLGMALRQLGRVDEALATLQHAVAMNGASAEARFQLGQLLQQLGRTREAVPHLRQAAILNSKDANKWHHLAGALFVLGDTAGGLQSLRRGVRAEPTSDRAHALLSTYLRMAGDAAATRAALEAWIEAMPRSRQAWEEFGSHCLQPGQQGAVPDAPAALWAGHRAAELSDGKGALAHWLIGAAAAQLGRQQQALPELRAALLADAPPLPAAERARCEQLLRQLAPPQPR